MATRKHTRARRARSSLRPRPSVQQHIEQQRRRLLGADAVIVCVQRAIDSRQAPPDEIRIGDALQVASDLVNDVVVHLDSVNLSKAGGGS
jgi:hypothetical protein